MPRFMKVSDFDFDLPPDLIAQTPAEPRESARLLHVGDTLGDRHVRDLPSLLSPGDLLVFNNTKVIPTRLRGKRREAGLEVTLHKQESGKTWWAFARPARKLSVGDKIDFAREFTANVLDKHTGGEVLLGFQQSDGDLITMLQQYGIMPLPPYIKRPKDGIPGDAADYQTVFAEKEGAVAAPTAGLHFSETLLKMLNTAGIQTAFVTLHVGAGTFLPVKVEETTDHQMHSEWGTIPAATLKLVNDTRSAGAAVVPVGSTSLRLLETAADDTGVLRPFTGETNIFMTPGHPFKIADKMITNFHLPKSTLFMLVAAFAGLNRMTAAYGHAIRSGYRFYSYGDACLLERGET